ncbi:S-methyl-5-thioribose-1-phosphate isomerase [Nitrososphaera sp.]|uniref:translation initiation factor eIF-2B n=1 Tax=Nitrososphaera sp. TaxID=1971748 RepID=UPI0017CAE54B|nr:S-methyl-5-thioribose-1-phosphate isomerase [Nitrososphaera sp.]NWG38212.1 S-methyl-5-thioribose-1-phosphate isomerase [Nitrososphaera sp.]
MPSLENVVEEIKSVRVQGAKEIAIYGLKFLRDFAKEQGFDSKFDQVAELLKEVRPTAVVLHNCIEIIKKERKISSMDRLIGYLTKSSEKIGRYSDKVLRNNTTIMTHCHSGEALAFVKHYGLDHKRKVSVIATETRPLEQGVKTAKELARAKIPVTLILDSAMGHFMKDADMVVVGADALRREGVINKIGTCLLAFAAKHHGKPFYVVANVLKLDKRKDFTIEERPAAEIYRKMTSARNLRGIKIRNPAFDITPWQYVTAVVTDEGIMKPSQLMRRLK